MTADPDDPLVRTYVHVEFILPRSVRRQLDVHLDGDSASISTIIRHAIEKELDRATDGRVLSIRLGAASPRSTNDGGDRSHDS